MNPATESQSSISVPCPLNLWASRPTTKVTGATAAYQGPGLVTAQKSPKGEGVSCWEELVLDSDFCPDPDLICTDVIGQYWHSPERAHSPQSWTWGWCRCPLYIGAQPGAQSCPGLSSSSWLGHWEHCGCWCAGLWLTPTLFLCE